MREVLEELQRRKDAKEDPCDSCDGTGMHVEKVCVDCLGQGILLSRSEYDTILAIAGVDDDRILEDEYLD